MRRLMGISVWGLIVLFSISVASAQSPAEGWKMTDAQSLADLTGADMRFETLSPDGTTVAWVNVDTLCLFTFAMSDQQCTAMPENFKGFGKYSYLSWSPDGKTLVFTEDAILHVDESDIWTYDVAGGTFEDRTDDGVYGRFMPHPDPNVLLDYLPVWSPVNGDLYFFRSTFSDQDAITTVQLLPLTRTEPKQVVDFSADFWVFSFYRPAAISPDGKQMAIIVLAQRLDDPQNGVYIINLEDGSVERVMTMDDIKLGMPEWAIAESQLHPDLVQWVGNEGMIVYALDENVYDGIWANAYYVSLASKSVTPMNDFSKIPDRSAFVGEEGDSNAPILQIPRAGVVSPDGSTYLYLGYKPDPTHAYVWSRALPPDGSEPTLIGEIDPFVITRAANALPAISTDGKHALLSGYRVTLEPPGA